MCCGRRPHPPFLVSNSNNHNNSSSNSSQPRCCSSNRWRLSETILSSFRGKDNNSKVRPSLRKPRLASHNNQTTTTTTTAFLRICLIWWLGEQFLLCLLSRSILHNSLSSSRGQLGVSPPQPLGQPGRQLPQDPQVPGRPSCSLRPSPSSPSLCPRPSRRQTSLGCPRPSLGRWRASRGPTWRRGSGASGTSRWGIT